MENIISGWLSRGIIYILIAGGTILCSGCARENVPPSEVQQISAAEHEENPVTGTHVMEQESIEEVQSVGKGQIEYDNTALTEEQSEVLKNFMDVYFNSLASLSLIENEDLYENNTAYEADESSINFQIGLRELAEGADYSLLFYDYIRCIDIGTEDCTDTGYRIKEIWRISYFCVKRNGEWMEDSKPHDV